MMKQILAFGITIVNLLLIHSAIAQNPYFENQKVHNQVYGEQQMITNQIKLEFDRLKEQKQPELGGEKIFSPFVLPQFYVNREYHPAWKNYHAFMDAINGLQGSFDDGLNPDDYHFKKIKKLVEDLNGEFPGNIDLKQVAQLDILITDAVLLYAYHLLVGKVDPETLDPNWNYSFKEVMEDAPYLLEKAVETASVSKELQKLRPKNQTYGRTMEMLKFYREIAQNDGWPKVPEGNVLREGDNDERIKLIRKRLAASKELAALKNSESSVYDSSLVADIKRFQYRNGLTPDGVIGKGTIEILNIPVESRINTLRVNLERNRWIDSDLSENYIIVNVAAFKAYLMEGHQLKFSTNVQVGKPFTETPIFKDRLRYIEFNPTWTVPTSIIGNTVIPKMKNDPNYIAANNFELIDASGKVVPQSQVNESELKLKNFRYTVRQKPGPDNALGEVKFIFPNKHAVYLHDTPSKSLFEKEERAFSHGCIRTQHPLDLAEVLLEGTDWTREKIDSVIRTRVTTRAFPPKDIDVLLMYWTAGYLEGEGFGFFRDVYQRDGLLLTQLNNSEMTKPPKRKN